jgi:hypothetical protein
VFGEKLMKIKIRFFIFKSKRPLKIKITYFWLPQKKSLFLKNFSWQSNAAGNDLNFGDICRPRIYEIPIVMCGVHSQAVPENQERRK